MKKLATVVLSCLLMFCLVACSSGGSGSTSSADTSSSSVSSASDETSATTEESSTDLGNVLVVYYSATGNTERVANSIAEATGDDLNWNDESSRVSREYEDESLRDVPLVNTTVDGWDDYDTVFIGYPIWWGIAAWPVDGFVEANDFSDKTVIPFATSASSGMGQSGELLADLAGTGDWQDGMRFSSGAGDDEVQEWVETLA